jgi:polysaccharide export outer membrane protein
MLVAGAIALQGCVIAPGMTMDEPAELPEGKMVRVQTLTMDLLNQLEATHKTEVRQVAEEFAVRREEYLIGPGDVIQVIVWDHPELTIPAGSFRDAETSGQQVGEDGYMFYPYVGMVKAGGMNIAALRDYLTDRLSRYIQNPQLDVRVIGFRSKRVYVVGEVQTPGVLPLNDLPMTIADAISLSGGLTPNAWKSGVNVSRNGKVYEIDLRALYEWARYGSPRPSRSSTVSSRWRPHSARSVGSTRTRRIRARSISSAVPTATIRRSFTLTPGSPPACCSPSASTCRPRTWSSSIRPVCRNGTASSVSCCPPLLS